MLESEGTKAIKWFGDNKMQANPDKFQAIIPGKSGHENCTSLTMCGSEIKCDDSVKLLGVTIDFMLNFDTHVTGRHLTVETKILIYKSFIKSNFNYCPPWCGIFVLKVVLRRWKSCSTEHFDFTSAYEAFLERANMPTLNISRIRLMAIETFKILHKMTPLYLHDIVSYKESNYSFRYEKVADIPRVRTTRYRRLATRRRWCGTVSQVSLGDWFTPGVAPRANILCVNPVNFNPVFVILYLIF